MLIHALCDYYDKLERAGEVPPDGYSNVKIHYHVALNSDGTIAQIVDNQEEVVVSKDKKGNPKTKLQPRLEQMPKRTEKTAHDANFIEHRPEYIFGLVYEKGDLLFTDETEDKHRLLVATNLKFIDGIDSPAVNAYRNFLRNWNPKEECNNKSLKGLGAKYKSGFSFYLYGHLECMLHEDAAIIQRWEERKTSADGGASLRAQCAIMGKQLPIARVHSKIKGVYGGRTTGSSLISFNNDSECSYGNEQSYNSNISELAMNKYTEALNYLLREKSHHALIGDLTFVSWSASLHDANNDLINALMFDASDTWDEEQTERVLASALYRAKYGTVQKEQLCTDRIDPDVDFYILGLKPNPPRLSVKFLYKNRFGDILYHVAQHQQDMKIKEGERLISISRITKELVSPKSTNEKVSPALVMQLMHAILYGTEYPNAWFASIVRRIKTDTDIPVYPIRAGIIKAYLNRKNRLRGKEEEIQMALDKENTNAAYLCGRLFAVLEHIQKQAAGGSLNRSIKTTYFASASSKPAIIFPKLLKLAQNHLQKISSDERKEIYFNKLLQEIIGKLGTQFPTTLALAEQGTFIIGYYQQTEDFYTKKETTEETI